MGGEAQLIQVPGEQLGDLTIAVDHKDLLGGGGEVLDPRQQVVPVSVRGQALEVDNAGIDGDLLAKQFHGLSPLQQTAAQRALCLIAHKDHGALLTPEVVLQVVADPAGIAHSRGGDDDLGAFVHIQSLGLVGGLYQSQAGEGEQIFSPLEDSDGLLIQIAPQVTGVDPGCLCRQGAVHTDLEGGEALHQALVLDLPQEIEQLLGAAHSKGGDDDVAAPGEGVVDELGQGLHIALRDLVVPVAVGGLHHHIVCLFQKLRIADDGLIDIA